MSTPNEGANGASQVVDCSGASRVEAAPPNGTYDFTVIGAEVKLGKADERGQQSMYANVHIQLDTEPAKNRHVFDMLMIRLKDGSIPGTAAALARNYSTPFILGGLLDAAKLPSNKLTVGPIEGLRGFKGRGVFRAEADQSGEERLKLRKVVGAPTGTGFTPAAKRKTAADAEDFS